MRGAVVAVALLAAGAGSLAWAQSSPSYRITGSSLVATAGSSSSPQFALRLVGGEGSPAQGASSPLYAVAIGPGLPALPGGETIFASGFESSP
jgi:hypothetical protein